VFRAYFINNRGDEQITWNYLDITARASRRVGGLS
jgi:predicted dithiol-disulfide oxidoreductase (DUF899 family)